MSVTVSESKYYVYQHKTDSGRVFYVGKGCGDRYKSRSNRNRYWKFVSAKNGFNPEIVEKSMPEHMAYELEVALIEFYKDAGVQLTNFSLGGAGGLGLKQSPETCLKKSLSQKGAKRSAEARLNMSKACIGRKISEETRKKLSKINTGKKHSDENKAKISAGLLGKKRTPEQIEKFKISQQKMRETYIVSEETKKKMSDSRKAYKQSSETLAKQKASLSGRNASFETIQKMILAQSNRKPVSEGTRLKMSISAKNRKDRSS